MSTSILILPVELLREIIEWTTCPPKKASLKNICMVNRLFAAIVHPMMLVNIKLGGGMNGYPSRNDQIRVLSLGTHPACQLARSMTLRLCNESWGPLQRSLKRAITNCNYLETIIWHLGPGEPPWVQNEVLSALYHLPVLKSLHIHVQPSYLYRLRLSTGSLLPALKCLRIDYLSLGYFENEAARQISGRNLAQLISRCPNLDTLDVAFPGLDLTDILPGIRSGDMRRIPPIKQLSLYGIGKIALVRDLPNLQTLSVRQDPDGQFLDIWHLLRHRSIFPPKILTDRSISESDLLDFLADHPNIESLSLFPINVNNNPSLDAFTEKSAMLRLCHILRNNSQHLVEFVMRPSPTFSSLYWNWDWMRVGITPVILACQNLQCLGFRISEEPREMRTSLHQLLHLAAQPALDNMRELHVYFQSDVEIPHPLAPRPFMDWHSNNPSGLLKSEIERVILAYEVQDWTRYNYELHIHQRIWTVRFGETRFTCTHPSPQR